MLTEGEISELFAFALPVAHELVSPQRWQTVMDCRTGGDKNVSKAMARE